MIRLLLLVSIVASATSAPAAILFKEISTFAIVGDGITDVSTDLPNPLGATAAANLPGLASITTTAFVIAGDSANFAGSFVHLRSSDVAGLAGGSLYLGFKTDVDIPYSASGMLQSSGGGVTQLYSHLYDHTTDTYLYRSVQASSDIPVDFSLGNFDGNLSNDFMGSLTGILLAGHAYQWLNEVYNQALPVADGGAVASGEVSLIVGVVPEPSTMFLVVTAIITLPIRRRKSVPRNRV